jgi:hypothetical protein
MRTIPIGSPRVCHLGVTALTLAVTCTACSPASYKLVPVSGVVSLDGQPLAGGIVNFQPMILGSGANAGPGSTARTGTDGRFTLATIRGAQGAVVGDHIVKIYSFNAETAMRSATGDALERERVPSRYNYTSDLTFNVPAAGTEQADFQLMTK